MIRKSCINLLPTHGILVGNLRVPIYINLCNRFLWRVLSFSLFCDEVVVVGIK